MNKQTKNNSEFNQDDLAQLFNYPSIGELFGDSNGGRLDSFRQKLNITRESLDRIIRYGKRDEAESAAQALRAVEVTLNFLETLQKMRLSNQK